MFKRLLLFTTIAACSTQLRAQSDTLLFSHPNLEATILKQHNMAAWGIPAGNYSGITPLGRDRYAVVTDKATANGFYEFEIVLDANGDVAYMQNHGFRQDSITTSYVRDAEGIIYQPFYHSLFISAENDQQILEYSFNGQPTGRKLQVPMEVDKNHIAGNYGFEALGYSPETHCIWTTTENTLKADGEVSGVENSTPARLRLLSFSDYDLNLNAQYAYQTDNPKAQKASDRNYSFGVPEITALEDGSLLVLEREFYVPQAYLGSFVVNKLYRVFPSSDYSVSFEDSLQNLPAERFLPKALITEFTTSLPNISNYEGMCLGPTLPDGTMTLLLICDSQDNYGNSLFHLTDNIRVILLKGMVETIDVATTERKMNYVPEGNSLVSKNGNNRFTRALYGSHSAFRIETSDRPIFAVTDGKKAKNILLSLSVGNQTFPLDSTNYCEARYEAGKRSYVLRDSKWGDGEIVLSVMANSEKDGGIWKVESSGLAEGAELTVSLLPCQSSKLTRGGDIGSFASANRLEPDMNKGAISSISFPINNNTNFFSFIDDELCHNKGLEHVWEKEGDTLKALTSSVSFSTPDPFINPLGGILTTAADGAWDGTVWNHGAVGWRTPLPGWRAAYMGDMLGMFDRQQTHFDAYAKSQVTGVPVTKPHLMDEENNLARGAYEWGTPMYSNGYICRNPGKNNQFHHYDMNLVFVDELLRHFQFDADTTYMRKMWNLLQSHFAWEKNTFDPDNDHLYDAYCCIWASDALQYNSGAGTHSSAYNYYANRQMARIAELLGENPAPYREEADAILNAMNEQLWLKDNRHWAEFKDFMGLKQVHPDAALWSIYTPIDCEACTPQQAYSATKYIDENIPHIFFSSNGETFSTISTSDWQPYEWSINNIAMAEVMHTALAYYKAGRPDSAYKLLKGTILDFMYLGSSPGNFGQLSSLDAATGEGYRDFSDVTGISSRTLIEGLFGITPDALNGKCIIRPGFPSEWNEASIHTPYLDYSFERKDGKDSFIISQHFSKPLTIVIRQNKDKGEYQDFIFSTDSIQTVSIPTFILDDKNETTFQRSTQTNKGCDFFNIIPSKCTPIDISNLFNSKVTDIFENKYLTPRSPYTTLCLPTQGIGDWCSTKRTANIDDSGIRNLSNEGIIRLLNIPFFTPKEDQNVIYTSLWDNYPDSVSIPLAGKASHVYLMMVGSTNPMQSHFDNAIVKVEYMDETSDTLKLRNPDNWCPIEQDYFNDGKAYRLPSPLPYRVSLSTGITSRNLRKQLFTKSSKSSDQPEDKKPIFSISGGAAQLYDLPLNHKKKLRSLTVKTLANDVVVGVMSVTLQK